MKKKWLKPTLVPHQVKALNKFGRLNGRESMAMEKFEDVPISPLVEKYGSPLFLLSESRLRNRARALQRAFKTRYPRVVQSWSYKTNYLNAVCQILHDEQAIAEVVSKFEYEKARALGVPGHKIIFNGPAKKKDILRRAVLECAQINVDHLEELYALEEISHALGRDVEVGLRLNFNTGFSDSWSRFGFNLESGQAMAAARIIQGSARLKLTSLHSHLGTFVLDPRAYGAQVRIMCEFMRLVEKETGCRIATLDIGGGFPSMNSLQGTYQPPEQLNPSIDQYAEVICDQLHAETKGRRPQPTLVLESGRHVVDEAEILISSVIGTKRLPDGRRAAVLDAGINLLFTGFWYNHAVMPVQYVSGVPEDTVLYGPLCMNIDVMRHSVMLPPIKEGQQLAFFPVGAYNNTQWMQFIEYRPAVVLIDPKGNDWLIRAPEDIESMTALETLPPHLDRSFFEKDDLPKAANG